MTNIHFFGKNQGAFRSILDVLDEVPGYEVYYSMYDIGEGNGDINLAKYIVTSFNSPNKMPHQREIHVGHGYGCISKIYNKTKEDFKNDYVRRYNAITMHGELQKQNYVDMGYPEERIMVIGSAMSIDMLAPEEEGAREKWLTSKGLDPTKKTVLYAPTWNQESDRGIFVAWFEDGQEMNRVYDMCDFITNTMGANLIVRLHDSHRYSSDWLSVYKKIFKMHGVFTTYMDHDSNPMPYLKYSDVLIGDQSGINTEFYIQDKPVVHIGSNAFHTKRNKGVGGWALEDRAGIVTDDFKEMLMSVEAYLVDPTFDSDLRQSMVEKYIAYTGEDAKAAVIREFDRITETTR